ncbi:MAG: hypothetical protein CMN31_07095 [Sandaracinus sp.]|nr:hypothetical protein [Sandaracinus sp.]
MSRSRLLRPGWLLLVLPAAFACFDPDRVPTGTTPSTETDPFACEDGRDNDGDGLVDCQDPDCIQRNFCGEIVPDLPPSGVEGTLRTCVDRIDNDEDGQFDCGDRDCQSIRELCCVSEFSDVSCSDGIDNDGNGFADCQDFACRRNPFVTVCNEETVCDDGFDNDGDRQTDCNDDDCDGDPACGAGPEDSDAACSDGVDNDADGDTDCDDPDCAGTTPCSIEMGPEDTVARCTDGGDNDGDGFTDCADFDCCGDRECTMPIDPAVDEFCNGGGDAENTTEACTDGVDNDGNGFVDCAEFGCCNSDGDCINDDVQAYCDARSETSCAACSDGIDNDGNGFTDCGDFSCSRSNEVCDGVPLRDRCESSYASCTDGRDNEDDDFADCGDFSCQDVLQLVTLVGPDGEPRMVPASPCDESVVDADADGEPDSIEDLLDLRLADPDTFFTRAYQQAQGRCTDGVDNDSDGFVDCDDWDCQWNPLLNPQTQRPLVEGGDPPLGPGPGLCQGGFFDRDTLTWRLPREGEVIQVPPEEQVSLLCR